MEMLADPVLQGREYPRHTDCDMVLFTGATVAVDGGELSVKRRTFQCTAGGRGRGLGG